MAAKKSENNGGNSGTVTEETWWTRPCGGFDVLRLALPIIISSGSISLMNFTDRFFLWQVNSDAMTASLLGGMLFWTVMAIPAGIAMFTTTFVAQYHGSDNDSHIGPIVWQGIWVGVATMPLLFLLQPLLLCFFALFGHDPELLEMETSYFNIMLWGVSAAVGSEAASSFFRGRGQMQVEMFINLFCVFLNVVLDYVLIFGKWGFPAWRLEGAAIATMVAQWVRLGIYLVLIFWADAKEKRYNILAGMRFDWPLMKRLLYFGMPSSSFVFLDNITFTVFLMIIGGLGKTEAGATTIAFTFNNFSFIPLIGIGIVVTTMVGNQLGNNRVDLARRATNTAAVMGIAYTGVLGILLLTIPDILLAGFAMNTPPEEFAAVRDVTVILVQFIALYLFFDCISVVFCAALRGAGDSFYIMAVVLVLAPLLPLLCFVGVKFFGMGVIGCWIILTALVMAYCAAFAVRYFGGKWEKIRVIETDLLKRD